MSKALITVLGKTIKNVAKIRGGGSALPGLIVEKIDPNFLKSTLCSLPGGVVVISGTNGKTTTTKIVVELLESQGLKVFTNRTGSNFTRGVVAALLGEVDIKGNLNADIAVLELDEAHAVNFVQSIKPRYSLILNVMRDQLDRFGEIDHTTNLLRQVADATTDTVVLNREDYRIASIAKSINPKYINFFGLDEKLLKSFPNDDNFHKKNDVKKSTVKANVILRQIKGREATFEINNNLITTSLKINGIYNIFNSTAALSLVYSIVGNKINEQTLINTLSKVTPAFGRGEKLLINNIPIEIILVKNPSGFQLALESFNPKDYETMIAINDNYADGRDMSWLWDVDFSSLSKYGVKQISGIRAYDIALRLQYDEVNFDYIDTNIKKSVKKFIENNTTTPKRIFATYTAMMSIRKELAKITNVEVIK